MNSKAAALFAVLICLPALSRAESKSLVCRDSKGNVQIKAQLETSSLAMTLDKRSLHPISASKDISFNCPQPPASMASTLNYTVSDAHVWGQYVLMLPQDVSTKKSSFSATLWSCNYDGEWHDAYETALDCSLSAP